MEDRTKSLTVQAYLISEGFQHNEILRICKAQKIRLSDLFNEIPVEVQGYLLTVCTASD